jgi:CheY-like chemotaxis protein
MGQKQSVSSPNHHGESSVLLCIDDSEIILEILTSILKRSGYSVFGAASGSQALEILVDHAVDLVILDWEMPEMNGRETASEIRRMKPAMPIIINSGLPEIPEDAFAVADAFVSKGAEHDTLLAAITELIAGRQREDSSERKGGLQHARQSD